MKDKKKENGFFKNLVMTWKFTKGCRRYLVGIIVFSTLLSVIGAILPTLRGKQIVYLNNTFWERLICLTAIILFFELSINIVRALSGRFENLFYRETLKNIQIELAKETVKVETEEIDNNTSGLFIDRLTKDSEKLASIFVELFDVFSEIIINIGVFVAIFLVSKIMFIFFIVSAILLFTCSRLRVKNKFKIDKEKRAFNEKRTGLIGEMVRGLRDVKVLNAERSFINTVSDHIVESNRLTFKMNEVNRKWRILHGTVHDILDFLFVILGIFLVGKDMLVIENFVILYMYKDRTNMVLNYIANMLEITKDFNLSANRVFELFEGDKFKKEKFGTVKLDTIKGNFEFKNVNFVYRDDLPVLNDISFKIKANETVAFVGRSGGGKTTIFSLLAKLYHPQSGEILIDGHNIEELSKDTIRGNISIITQNPYIFNMSIKDNLKIVKPNLTNKEMVDVCKKACLDDFVNTLPDKYDTIVGEGGVTLSGGQRQRLAIARAFIRKTEIILFDEATSALDNETQEHIQNAINNLQKDKTILIIAHRLSTVINADRIMIVDGGKIVGEGTHKELLKGNKLYKELYTTELQKGNK